MSRIEQLAKQQSQAPSPYDISRQQVEIYPTLTEPEKEGVILFETLSFHFSSGVIEVLARHIPYVDAETQLYIAREIRDESQHFTRCVNACKLLAIRPLDFFPDIRRIYGERPNWLRYMAGCAFTLEQMAVHVFGKFLSRGSRYFQPVKPFVGEDADHFSHSLLQLREALQPVNRVDGPENARIITEAIRESLDSYAPAFFEHITRVITLGTNVTRTEVEEEWRVAFRGLKNSCDSLGLAVALEPAAWRLPS